MHPYVPYVHSIIIYNSQELEIAQAPLFYPLSRSVYKKAVVRLHNGILCSYKKEGTLTLCNSMDGPGEHYAK